MRNCLWQDMTQCAVHCRRGIRKPTYKGVSKSWWLDLRNQREFWDDLAKAEGVTRLCDWYNIKKSHVTQHGGKPFSSLWDDKGVIHHSFRIRTIAFV